jgi:2-amino-4-hydroxy-6-hydroxymethyldihydropteridine diphosphokinase
VASTEGKREALPDVVRAAAAGQLPEWAEVTESRRQHISRVAGLLANWAESLRLAPDERLRWAAAGWLHDALRDAPPERLRSALPDSFRDFPGKLLHGPATAERLKDELDPSLLNAIRYHTTGHPLLDRVGRALYLADFLEPGREFEREWRGQLRDRMPADLDAVLIEVVASRVRGMVDDRRPLRPETAAFWSALVAERDER